MKSAAAVAALFATASLVAAAPQDGEKNPIRDDDVANNDQLYNDMYNDMCAVRLERQDSEEDWKQCLKAVKECHAMPDNKLEWPKIKFSSNTLEECFTAKMPAQKVVASDTPLQHTCRSMGARSGPDGPCQKSLRRVFDAELRPDQKADVMECLTTGKKGQGGDNLVYKSDLLGAICWGQSLYKELMPKHMTGHDCTKQLRKALGDKADVCFASEAEEQAREQEWAKNDEERERRNRESEERDRKERQKVREMQEKGEKDNRKAATDKKCGTVPEKNRVSCHKAVEWCMEEDETSFSFSLDEICFRNMLFVLTQG